MAEPIVNSVISSASDCTIKVFIKCKFDKDLSALAISGIPSAEELTNAWETINAEFVDLSGIDIPELDLMRTIHELKCRVEASKCFFQLQHIWLLHFNEPPQPAITAMDELKKYGYRLEWTGDKKVFKRQLAKYELKEKKNEVKLIEKEKELDNFHAAEEQAETNPAVKKTIRNSRTEFIKLLTELQKFGYPINREVTTVEELAIMYKEYSGYCASSSPKN
jgi:hypothetical protein